MESIHSGGPSPSADLESRVRSMQRGSIRKRKAPPDVSSSEYSSSSHDAPISTPPCPESPQEEEPQNLWRSPLDSPAEHLHATIDRSPDDHDAEEGRGKKGLTYEEMAQFQRPDESDRDPTMSCSDGGGGRGSVVHSESPNVYVEDDVVEHPSSPWSEHQVNPIVRKAMDILETKGMDISNFGYARLTVAGRGAFDYLVRHRSIIIGRMGYGANCEVLSEHRLVSKKHARLFWDEKSDRWFIACLSSNGLLVDGVPVSPLSLPVPLQSRSLIEMGDVAFFFLAPTDTVFRVSNLQILESMVLRMQQINEDSESVGEASYPEHYDGARMNGGRARKRSKASYNADGTVDAHSEISKKRDGRSNNVPSSSKKGDTLKKGKARALKKRRRFHEPGSSDTNTEEEEEEEEAIPDLLHDQKYNPALFPSHLKRPINNTAEKSELRAKKKRRKRRASMDTAESTDDHEPASFLEDWNKKDRSDFGRALFAVGVTPLYDENRNLTGFNWDRFRRIAGLARKSDDMLLEYYRQFMTDVHTLLDEEEIEKKTKGPRTKHKKGCMCSVCKNKTKVRQKGKDGSFLDGRTDGDMDYRTVKSTARPNDKLLGLITAQKLRVRLGIHEAALQIDSHPARQVLQKIGHSGVEVKDFPPWWMKGYHDLTLMQGVGLHGVGQWSEIWNDDNLKRFARVRKQKGCYMILPSSQAVMKRVRDVASMIMVEMKNEAIKDAESRRYLKRKEKRQAKRDAIGLPRPIGLSKQTMGDSGGKYTSVNEGIPSFESDGSGLKMNQGGESTAEESESVEVEDEDGTIFKGVMPGEEGKSWGMKCEAEVETEDEDEDDGIEDGTMEVEVDERFDGGDVEVFDSDVDMIDEVDMQALERKGDDWNGNREMFDNGEYASSAMGVAESTEEEGDGGGEEEEQIEYETASESGSE